MAKQRKAGKRKARGARAAEKHSLQFDLGAQARFALTLSIAAAFVWGLYLLAGVNPDEPDKHSSATIQSDSPAKNSVAEKANTSEYTFYSRLKDFVVEVPEPHGTERQQQNYQRSSYMIQAGSFKTNAQADRLRAKLILLGLEPRIEENINSRNERWYRVMLGPFDSRSKMANTRSTLISNQVDALVMQRKSQAG